MPALENLCFGLEWWWFVVGLVGLVGLVGGVCVLPDDPLAEALAVWDCFVPEKLDWPAEEDGAYDCPARPGEDKSHEAEA